LSRAGLADEHHADVRGGDRFQPRQLLAERGRERGELRQLRRVQRGRRSRRRRGLAEEEERMTYLEQIAVRQRRLLDARAVQPGAILGFQILDAPARAHAAELRVIRRDAAVAELQPELLAILLAVAPGSP